MGENVLFHWPYPRHAQISSTSFGKCKITCIHSGGASAENPLAYAGKVRDPGLTPGSGRSPGEETHSTILTWRIPWTEEPGGLWSTGSQSEMSKVTEHTHIITVPYRLVSLSYSSIISGNTHLLLSLQFWLFQNIT